MYNEAMAMDVEDFDEDIRLRKQLIEEARQIAAGDDRSMIYKEINRLKRQWKKIPFRDSAYENELSEEFDAVMDNLYAIRNEGYQGNEERKRELISQAKQCAESDQFRDAGEQMNELMEEWKAVGSAGKEIDDALWEEFRAERQKFFDRRRQFWDNRKVQFANAKEIKEGLIVKARALQDSSEWQKTSEALRVLMEEWKAAGSAGKEHEDELWNEFNQCRQAFYDRRNQYYEELHEVQKQRLQQKRELISQAKAILAEQLFQKEDTAKMKELGVEWKHIGSCGKGKDDEIWAEFRSVMDEYFDALKAMNEQKHAHWRQRMSEMRTRKQELIQDQKRQIKRMEEEIIGLLGERAIVDMEDRIEDKKDFIAELENEVAELEQRLDEDERKDEPQPRAENE